jgi:hypothetical protein
VAITLPARNRAIVLVSKLHLPTLRALSYARATRPSHLEAVTVEVDETETLALRQEWDRSGIPVPLTVVASPYREITRPVVDYVKRIRRESPHDIVTLYVPEYVLGHWWEQLLHNQSALRLKTRLLLQPGVVVASVPYQLRSAVELRQAAEPAGAGAGPEGDARPAPSAPAPRPAAGSVPVAATARAAGTSHGAAASPATGRARAGSRSLQRLTADRDLLDAEDLQAEASEASATPIADCPDHEFVTVAGVLRAVTLRPRGTSLTMEADLWDGTGSLNLIWLGRRAIRGIRPGRRIVVHGRIAQIQDQRTMYNPGYQLRPGPDSPDPG